MATGQGFTWPLAKVLLGHWPKFYLATGQGFYNDDDDDDNNDANDDDGDGGDGGDGNGDDGNGEGDGD